MTKLVHFDSGFIDNSNYSINDDGTVVTGGLILVEGTHTDSRKKTHTFTKERLFKIADNSNALFESGAVIPVLDNHNKSTKDTLGTVESPFRIEVITQDNLPNKRAKHLIGKLGLFVDEVVIKAADAVEKVAKNIVKTVSPGLDLQTETIREVSLTPQPAIVGMALYSETANNTALTFDELRNSSSQFDEIEEEYETLTEQLWIITRNIQMADDTAIPDEKTRYELQMQAIDTFVDDFISLLGLNQEIEDDSEEQDPRLMRQGNGANPNMYYSNDLSLAAFSMADMENTLINTNDNNNMNRPIAAFSMSDYEGLTRNAYQAAEFKRGKDKQKRKRRGLGFYAGAGAAGLAGASALAGGIRYGMAGVKEAGMKDTRYYKNGKPIKAGSLEDRARKFGVGARSQVSRDIESAKQLGGRVKQGATNVKTQAQMMAKDARYYAGQGIDKTKASGSRAMSALKSGKGLGGKLSGAWKSGAVGKAGLIGAGLSAAGLAAGAGYGAYRMMNRKKKNK